MVAVHAKHVWLRNMTTIVVGVRKAWFDVLFVGRVLRGCSPATLVLAKDCEDMATQAPGLDAIYKACRNIYPNQLNPLQIAALVKYW